jgi:hypothetical protein
VFATARMPEGSIFDMAVWLLGLEMERRA